MLICKNRQPIVNPGDSTILPSDISTFPYIVLDVCCETADELVMLTTLSGLQPSESVEVTISGGCPPFKWEAEAPLFFTELYTNTRTNTLYLDANATAQNNVSAFSISDICYNQGSSTTAAITGETAVVTQSGTGDPWALVFYAPTVDCFIDGMVSNINLIPTWTITSVSCINVDSSATGTNPVALTVPAGDTSFKSLSVSMYAPGYHWANGDPVYGNAVTIVWYCDCSEESASITYTTQQLGAGASQTLGVDGNWSPCFSWSLEGGGSLGTTADNGDVILTAPTTNEGCNNNMVVSLLSDDIVIDTLNVAMSEIGSITTWYIVTSPCNAYSPTWVKCGVSSWYCNGGQNIGAGGYSVYGSLSACEAAGCTEVGNIMDHRSDAQIADGCCPYQLM